MFLLSRFVFLREKGNKKDLHPQRKPVIGLISWDKSLKNFCGATQIDNCLSAHDAPARILPCNGGTPSAPTCLRVQPALRSPFGKRLSAALAPPGSSLGEILSAYSSASTVSSWLGLYSGQTGLSSVFFSKPTKFLGYPDACKWRAHML